MVRHISVAYYEGPDRYHASYSVCVKTEDLHDASSQLEKTTEQDITQFTALVRVNETTSKVTALFLSSKVTDTQQLV